MNRPQSPQACLTFPMCRAGKHKYSSTIRSIAEIEVKQCYQRLSQLRNMHTQLLTHTLEAHCLAYCRRRDSPIPHLDNESLSLSNVFRMSAGHTLLSSLKTEASVSMCLRSLSNRRKSQVDQLIILVLFPSEKFFISVSFLFRETWQLRCV